MSAGRPHRLSRRAPRREAGTPVRGPHPALALALRPLPLTAREREIVELAARGHANKDIAQRLTVSVRTVEGHLYRATRKLGVSERAALADVLGIE